MSSGRTKLLPWKSAFTFAQRKSAIPARGEAPKVMYLVMSSPAFEILR